MKKILLLGDSIRMGYDSFVKKELKEYEVYYDDTDNGRFSSYTIWQFNLLNNKFGPFDVVHFNNGYWDMNHEGPKGEEAFPLEDYLHNLKRLIGLIRETKAIPIFALTTPICDKLQTIPGFGPLGYKNEWVIKYNEAAKELMAKENVLVNDLYTLLLDDEHYYKCEDSLHLTEAGYKKCALEVSKMVREVLK